MGLCGCRVSGLLNLLGGDWAYVVPYGLLNVRKGYNYLEDHPHICSHTPVVLT